MAAEGRTTRMAFLFEGRKSMKTILFIYQCKLTEVDKRPTVRNVSSKTLFTTVYNLSIYKTVSVETPKKLKNLKSWKKS